MSYSRILFSVLIGLLMISCTTDSVTEEQEKPKVEEPPVEEPITWKEQGLQGIEVFTVVQAGDYLLAGTEEGLYRAYIFDQLGWQYMGPGQDSVRVTDLIVFSEQELMAAAGGSKVVYKSEDLGETWEGWALDIPDETDHRNRLSEIEVNTANPDIIFGLSGHSIIDSEDAGRTWKRTYSGGFSDFLYVSSEYPNQVWTGGTMPAMVPYLAKSDDGGETWTLLNSKIQGDISANAVTIYPENEEVVLASAGNIIQKSEDGGETWEAKLDGFAVLAFENSKENTDKLYASLLSSDGLFMAVSNDFGETWRIDEYEDSPAQMRVHDIVSLKQDDEIIIYIATNQGMFSYQFEE